jgi:CubicO group peptidase (beta-lactamase class C family)
MASFDTIGDYIQDSMQSWRIPGAAVAVIRGDEIIHLEGYGVRDIETKTPVTPETRFAIASCTKAFTAMGVALLVDDGLAEWDKPVREYLPWFKMRDEYAAAHISLRDMLCHRSGLPRHDLSWYNNAEFTREDLIRNVAHHELSAGFRATWQYQNLMFVTAGYVTGLLTGTTWEDFIQKRIFDALGMTGSSFSAEAMRQSDDYALPYKVNREQDAAELMPFYDNPIMGPAGSIHSSVADLARWVQVHLNGGKLGDFQLVSPGNLETMHRPQMIMPVDGMRARLRGSTIATYGLGWFVEPYRGYTMVQHGGNIDGFASLVSLLPEQGLGVVVLTNIDAKPLRDELTFEIYDRLLDLSDHEWNRKYHAIYSEIDKANDQEGETFDAERIPDAPTTHPLPDYTGEYHADGYADIKVRLTGEEKLEGWLNGYWWPLEHYHYDIFLLIAKRFDLRFKVSFALDGRGAIQSLSLPIEPAVKEVVYTRKPPTLDAPTAQAIAGEYQLPIEGMLLMVRAKPDGKLYIQLTGQKEAALQLYRADGDLVAFTLAKDANIALDFVREDGSGSAFTGAVLKQQGMVFKAARVS